MTDAFCRACAFRLVDVALSSTEDLEVLEEAVTDAFPTGHEGVRPRYGHYEVCQSPEGGPWELGRGAMGITYKATDLNLNCPVALKIINARRFGGAKAKDRFLLEARTAARLRHPNIASIFHLGPDDEECFYAMEYIDGETLEGIVQREGSLSTRLALNIVTQCARALRAAHAQSFIHRDIKPTNIMLLGNQGRATGEHLVKLIDFGLAKAMAGLPPSTSLDDAYFAGTPHYASPEQLQTGNVDARSDIYSLGMCLAYTLTGKLAESGNTASFGEPYQKESTDNSEAEIRNLRQSLVDLAKSMISQDPARRPQTAEELLGRISELTDRNLNASSPLARRHFWQQVGGLSPQMFPAVLLTVGLATLAIVVGAAAVIYHGQAKSGPGPRPIPVSAAARAHYSQAGESYRKFTAADNRKAIDQYQTAIALCPEYVEAYIDLAQAHFDNACKYAAPASELDQAVIEAKQAIALRPNASGAYQVLGAIRGYQGHPWDALVELRRALELSPDNAAAMCDFSLLWVCVGKPQLALPWAKASANLQPSRTVGWHAAAEASVELCDDETAEDCYRRCAEIEPTWMSPYCGLMHIHLLQEKFDQARLDHSKAESIQAGQILPLTLDAQLALFSGDYAGAELCYRRLLLMNRRGLVRYYSGISYLSALGYLRLRAGDTEEGNTFLKEAESLHVSGSEGSADIYDLAAIRAIQNRTSDALTLLEQAIQSGWNDYRASRLDPRLSTLRGEPRFQQMLDGLSAQAANMRKEAAILCSKPLVLADYPVRFRENPAK